MWRRNSWILTLGLAAACLDAVSVPTGVKPPGEHLWLFHIAGGTYAEHVQLVAIGDNPDATGRRVFRPLPSRAWDGSIVNDFADFRASALDAQGLSWTLSSNGQTLGLNYSLNADTAIGALTLADGTSYPLFGVRFDSAAVNLIAPTLPPASHELLPVVLIRIDDVPSTDRDFLKRLITRGLTAEIAAPTRFLDRPNRLTWADLHYWSGQGMGVVLHSRYHLSTSADAQQFVGETVGGFAELATHGFASHI